jgi:diguanylate cyclase (GGDEF)-like protein
VGEVTVPHVESGRGQRAETTPTGALTGTPVVDAPGPAPGEPEQVLALRALHTVTRRVHASLDLADTLDAVARGVLEATCFGLVVINLRRPSGDYEVVSVEGDEGARAQLLGLVEPERQWRKVLERGQPWGQLRFVDHTDADVDGDTMYSWVPEFAPSEDPEAWHPLDALFAPLIARSGTLLGALSVDLPAGGQRPTRAQCEVLEMFADHAALAIEHARLTAELRASHDEMAHAAHHDPLTGLANRALLMERGHAAAAAAATGGGGLLAVLVLDLDGFKAVNDAAGHQAGDEVLQVLATRMHTCVRARDLLARAGGDEFVVLVSLSDPDDTALPHALADRLRAVCHEPVAVAGRQHQLGASIGVAFAKTPTDFENLLAAADSAMFTEKRAKHAAQR